MKVIIQHNIIGTTIVIPYVKSIETKDDQIIFKFDSTPDRWYWRDEWEIISAEDDK